MGYIEKNKKKILAIFAAGLMIAFTLPSTLGRGGSQTDAIRGTIAGKKVRNSDVERAFREYEYLAQSVAVKNPNNPTERTTVAHALLSPPAIHEIETHRDMYYLLLQDSQRMGVQISNDRVQEFLLNYIEIPPSLTADEEVYLRNSIAHLLGIREAFSRALSTIKISAPMRDHRLAEEAQSMTLKLVEFSVAEFRDKVPAPTPQQIDEQFTTYGNKDAENPEAANKFGFGYRYPNRVKLQYIELKHDDVKKAIQASRSAYDWDVAAQKYYRLNPTQYAAPTTQPSLKPFAQVHQEILDSMQDQEAQLRTQQMISAINSAIQTDYAAYVKDPKAASSVGPSYASFEYLQALASKMQKDFGVLPTIASISEGQSPKGLAKLPGIGAATVNGVNVSTYLMSRLEPLVAPEQRDRALKIMQPTPLIQDDSHNLYIARATEAVPARMAADKKEILPQMEADIRAAEAFKMARTNAEQFEASAAKSTFESAAAPSGRKVIVTGPCSIGMPMIPNYPLDETAIPSFMQQVIALINSDPKTGPHPMTIIELPRQGKVIAAQLNELKPMFDPSLLYTMDSQINQSLTRSMANPFFQSWFNYDELSARVDYKLDEGAKKKSASASEG